MGKGKPKGRRRGEKGEKGGEVGLAHTWRQFGQRNWSQKQSEQSRPKSLMIIPIERLRHCESKRERAYERERERGRERVWLCASETHSYAGQRTGNYTCANTLH